jgi:glycosyltransferase involved in cell wall biosynthesis
MLFSVIIPTYNSHEFINIALDSLSSQINSDFEVVIVDDASSIDSFRELKKKIEEYSFQINLIRLETNGGPGRARKEGLRHVSGEYIIFLDSDDQLEYNAFSTVCQVIEDNFPDIVLFDCYRTYLNKKVKLNTTNLFSSDFAVSDYIALSYDSMCCMCVKRMLLMSINLPELYNAEDAVSVPIIISRSRCTSFTQKALYDYNYRQGSLSTAASNKLVEGFIAAWQYLKDNIDERYREAFEFRLIRLVLYGVTFNLVRVDAANQKLNNIYNQFLSDYHTWWRNPYIKYLPLRKRFFLRMVKFRLWNILRLYVKTQEFINKIYSR